MSIIEAPGLVYKRFKTQFPEKNRLSNLYAGQTSYSLGNHLILAFRSGVVHACSSVVEYFPSICKAMGSIPLPHSSQKTDFFFLY